MAKDTNNEFKTLLSKAEYEKLIEMFADKPSNTQTNYYFDTRRFSLKAADAVLRVKRRDKLELTLERKKGYSVQKFNAILTEEQFNELGNTGKIPVAEIANELVDIQKDQPLINFMTLSTKRVYFPYKKGKICLDKCTYVDKTDYELEYVAANYEVGKIEFIEIIKEFGLTYRKSQAKIKRAYEALRNKL